MKEWFAATVVSSDAFGMVEDRFPVGAAVVIQLAGAAVKVFNPQTHGAAILPLQPIRVAVLDRTLPGAAQALKTKRNALGRQIPTGYDFTAHFLTALTETWIKADDTTLVTLAQAMAEAGAILRDARYAADQVEREAAAERRNETALYGETHGTALVFDTGDAGNDAEFAMVYHEIHG